MKKKILGIALLCSFIFTAAQVGIDTTTPNSTLHVREKRNTSNINTATAKDGIIPPSLTKQELSLKASGTYSSLQNGAMVFVTDVSLATNTADPSFGQVSNIDSTGYYYYSSSANKWIKLTPTAPIQDLRMLTNNNHVTQDAGFGSNGTSLGTGTDNIALGAVSLNANSSGNRNIAIGSNALKTETVASDNVAIGHNTLAQNNSTSNLVAIGSSAGAANTNGAQLTAVGGNALASNTTGNNNSAFGTNALTLNKTGNDNVALGSDALSRIVTSSSNIAIGNSSLSFYTDTGFGGNIGIGTAAGNSLTTGTNNILIGTRAFANTVVGNENIIIGTDAYRTVAATQQANYNTVLGRSAANYLPYGNYNTILGHSALNAYYPNTRTVAVGYGAGEGNATTTALIANDNTFLGTQSKIDDAKTTGDVSFATAIGSGSRVNTSNTIILGRIPGYPSNNSTQDNVGIGVIAPTNALHVKTTATADPVRIEGLQAETGTTNNVLVVDGTGVIKTASRSGMSGGTVTASNGLSKSVNDIQLGGPLTKSTSIVQGPNTLSFTSTVTNAFSVDGSTLSVDAANDRVGVGTITPSSTLEAKGSIEGNFSEMTGASYNLTASDYHVSFSGAANSVLNLPTTQSTTDNTAGDFRGRKYYIKNNSTTSSLTITAQGTQTIRYGGSKTASATYVLDAGSYAMITASGSGWDLDIVGSAAKASNWFLFDTALNYKKNESQAITSTYTNIDGGSVSVSVPNGYTQNKTVINFTGWGHATTSSGARGSLRFQIVQTQTGQPSVTYTSVMMSSWSTPSAANNGIRFNYPVVYTVDNLAPGTYSFALQVVREDENGNLLGTTPVLNWGIQSKADVYVKP